MNLFQLQDNEGEAEEPNQSLAVCKQQVWGWETSLPETKGFTSPNT